MSNYANENEGLEQQVSPTFRASHHEKCHKNELKTFSNRMHVFDKEEKKKIKYGSLDCENSCNPCKCRKKNVPDIRLGSAWALIEFLLRFQWFPLNI